MGKMVGFTWHNDTETGGPEPEWKEMWKDFLFCTILAIVLLGGLVALITWMSK